MVVPSWFFKVCRCVMSTTHHSIITTCGGKTTLAFRRIVHLQRWPIETFYQDGKGHLGLDTYRMRSTEAIGKHWCLVFVAYSFLHLDCLPSSPTKGSLPLKTIGEACRQQAQALMQALILYAHEQLQLGQKAADLFASLFAKQQPVIAR